jgi:hypothetical protein
MAGVLLGCQAQLNDTRLRGPCARGSRGQLPDKIRTLRDEGARLAGRALYLQYGLEAS